MYAGHQDRQIENDYQIMNEEGGEDSGEEHEYHILEGPGGEGSDGQSMETRRKEMGGATDYEIPVPLIKN